MSYTQDAMGLIQFGFPGAADSLPPQLLRSLQRMVPHGAVRFFYPDAFSRGLHFFQRHLAGTADT
jgi:hypothetical protein